MNKLFTWLVALLCATTSWAGPILSGSGTKDDPYLIGSLKDWREFSIYVSNNYTPFDECYKLTADIGPINDINYIIGYLHYPFKGIFDGDGHTLTMDFNSDTYGYVSPFFNIYDATIKNLHVTGEVTAAEPYAAGLVQEVESYYGNTIENCRVSTKIICNATTSGECMIGGFVGSNPDMELNITGCVFDGQIIAPNLTGCAGFVGWNDADRRGNVNITDCVFAPTAVNVQGGMTFVRSSKYGEDEYGEDYVKISNCFYTTPLGDVQGKAPHTITGNEGVTVAMAGEPTEYNMSGITVYSGSAGLKYNDIIYGGNGDVISLNLGGSDYGYTSSTGKITGLTNPFALTMEDADAVVSASQASDFFIITTESELRSAVRTDGINIKLDNDIDLSNKTLEIVGGTTVAIDLGGHALDRKLTKRGEGGGQVITVRKGATLNLSNGTLQGGWGGNAGGLSNEGGTANLTDVTITGCTGDDKGGGICNLDGGTLTMTGGALTGNTSIDKDDPTGGGGLFNAAGATASLKGVKVSDNVAKSKGGGGICNYGTMTLDGCTVTGNSCKMNGGGIWNKGTLNMQGVMTVTDNTTANSVTNNLFLKTDAIINVTGSLTGSSVGINMEKAGVFTSGFATYHSGTDPATIFTSDCEAFRIVSQNGEGHFVVDYIVCSWDSKNRQVVNTTKTLTRLIGYGDVPTEGDYKLVTNSNNDVDWFQLGGYNGDNDEYYVVSGNVSNNTLNVLGKKVHLILLDGAKLTLSGGILLYGDNHKLSIHCQSYESKMGELIITSGYIDEAAGIGSDWDGDETNGQRKAGDLTIHGGKLSVTGGKISAGIGGGYKQQAGKTTIYGGDIKAYGGSGVVHYGGAGIGGSEHGCGHLVIYGGKVYAEGRDNSPGIGSGVKVYSDPTVTNYKIDDGYPPYNDSKGTYAISVVDIYGGEVEARGANNGAGIGGGTESNGVILNVYGGDVKAYGGNDGAGIGGGWDGLGGYTVVKGGTVKAYGGGNAAGIGSGSQKHDITHGGILEVKGGHVEAYGGVDAAGIGGGEDSNGGVIIISGGYVYAEGNDYGPGIGGGQGGDGADVTITGGTVIAKKGANASGAIDADGDDAQLTLGDDRCAYITNNLWRCKKENRISDCLGAAYLQISKCLHGDATASIVDGEKHDISSCKWCYVTSEEAHTFGDDSQCDACGLIRLADEGDNSALFTKWSDGDAHDFLLSGRKLVPNEEGSRAYTVCLPFDMDLTDRGDDLMLYTLSYIKGGSEMVFTQAGKKIEAGKPYLIVIHQGELELLGHSPLCVTPNEGVRVYDWTNREQPLGWWRGTLTKIESADAAEMMAYALQSVGDFRRIRPDTPQAWWGAFRSMYCPDELPATNKFTINRGAFSGLGGQTNNVTFEGDAEIEEGTGIRLTPDPSLLRRGEIYNLSGQRLSKPQKGINIINSIKVLY